VSPFLFKRALDATRITAVQLLKCLGYLRGENRRVAEPKVNEFGLTEKSNRGTKPQSSPLRSFNGASLLKMQTQCFSK
jgi:hypothetical protein